MLKEDVRSYHCPRWGQLPDIELYMDQVVSVLDKNLRLFLDDAITPTMINNYVKQKLIRPPHNKKYDRGQIAHLYIITLMKRIMSLGEISQSLRTVTSVYSPEAAYDLFCDIFEYSLRLVFFADDSIDLPPASNRADAIIRSVSLAYANMLYVQYLLDKCGSEPLR